ncbi:hypothetical protein LEL_10201 [Akanthomyces lecanii RCEF 1005]|uniref:Uncharacterized protein n=1 Tax=Akanthomyces lecanii RCEF 1005 TaxID=1081108 RepID=A0A168AXI6_CORDF|nr:hypothetical protein LEL_10201 [Akanthomyces lecanii RCEF 1005]
MKVFSVVAGLVAVCSALALPLTERSSVYKSYMADRSVPEEKRSSVYKSYMADLGVHENEE